MGGDLAIPKGQAQWVLLRVRMTVSIMLSPSKGKAVSQFAHGGIQRKEMMCVTDKSPATGENKFVDPSLYLQLCNSNEIGLYKVAPMAG